MCRNIKNLFNFDPPATDEEVKDAALQFVRKLSGFNSPSQANSEVFYSAVDQVAIAARILLDNLSTNADPKNREIEAAKKREQNLKRFGNSAINRL
jgi:hypothetical protein